MFISRCKFGRTTCPERRKRSTNGQQISPRWRSLSRLSSRMGSLQSAGCGDGPRHRQGHRHHAKGGARELLGVRGIGAMGVRRLHGAAQSGPSYPRRWRSRGHVPLRPPRAPERPLPALPVPRLPRDRDHRVSVPKHDWAGIDWSRHTGEIARQMRVHESIVSAARRRYAPHTVRVWRHDWESVDWRKSNPAIAMRLGCDESLVSKYRSKLAPNTLRSSRNLEKWSKVDWSKPGRQIASEMSVVPSAVSQQKQRLLRLLEKVQRPKS
jgi:hypothetical protein